MDKFFEIYRDTKIYFDINSPLIIEALALYKDNSENRMLIQVKFRNIQEKTIIGCKVNVKEYEIDGTSTGDTTEYSYLDLNVSKGDVFGQKVPIYLKNIKTRKVHIEVINVVFNNYEVWKNNNKEWSVAETQKKIEEVFDNNNYLTIIRDKLGDKAKFVPINKENYWLCSCGTLNFHDAKVCYQCNNNIDEEIKLIDKNILQKIDEDNRTIKEEKEKNIVINNILIFDESYQGKEKELKKLTIDELDDIENQIHERRERAIYQRIESERVNKEESDAKKILIAIIITLIMLGAAIVRTRFLNK